MRKEDEEEDYLDDSESREYLSAGNEEKMEKKKHVYALRSIKSQKINT